MAPEFDWGNPIPIPPGPPVQPIDLSSALKMQALLEELARRHALEGGPQPAPGAAGVTPCRKPPLSTCPGSEAERAAIQPYRPV